MKKLSLTLATALAALLVGCGGPRAAQAPAAPAPTPIIELRLAFPDSAPGRVLHSFQDSVVYLARTALLSDADFTSVRDYHTGQEELILRITFSPETGQRLAKGLEPHIGGNLAVVIDGRVTSIVQIMSPIGAQGQMTVNTMLRGKEAERALDRVRDRWRNVSPAV